jgi:hypothetical protein
VHSRPLAHDSPLASPQIVRGRKPHPRFAELTKEEAGRVRVWDEEDRMMQDEVERREPEGGDEVQRRESPKPPKSRWAGLKRLFQWKIEWKDKGKVRSRVKEK